jgi:hypothetical protein
MLPRKKSSWIDEATPPEINAADVESQECMGYRASGKNGFVREHGSDQSTSVLDAELDDPTKTINASIPAISTTRTQVIFASPELAKPPQVIHATIGYALQATA